MQSLLIYICLNSCLTSVELFYVTTIFVCDVVDESLNYIQGFFGFFFGD